MQDPGPSMQEMQDGSHYVRRRDSGQTVSSSNSASTRSSGISGSSQTPSLRDISLHMSIPSVSSFHHDENAQREINNLRALLNSERTRADHAETQLLQVVTRLTQVNQERMVAMHENTALRDEIQCVVFWHAS